MGVYKVSEIYSEIHQWFKYVIDKKLILMTYRVVHLK